MDWINFIKDNSQALFTLGGVLLGSAITFLGNFLNSRFQAKENHKERLEKRREAKIQLMIELMQNDIQRVEAVNNLAFELLNKIKHLNFRRETGELDQEGWATEYRSMVTGKQGPIAKLGEVDTVTSVIVYAQGSEIYSSYDDYAKKFEEYMTILQNPATTDKEKEEASEKFVLSCAKLQKGLRDKLISIRDIE